MLNKFKNIYYGALIGIFILSILIISVLKVNNIWMNIDLIADYNQIVDVGKYPDNNKLKIILPKEILSSDVSFEKDIKKTLSYVATVINGRYSSNPNLTGYQKLKSILTQNGGGFVVIWL